MKQVKYSNCDKYFAVEDEDFQKIFGYNWVRRDGSIISRFGERLITLPYFILGSPGPGFVWDHIDKNFENNLRSNFRKATYSQNTANHVKRKRNGSTSRFFGVYLHPISKRWVARITVNYKQHCLGTFDVEEDAARAYDEAAIRYFGEFATLNFPAT